MNVLLIGLGSIGKRHLELLEEMYSQITVDLVSGSSSTAQYKHLTDVPDAALKTYHLFIICSQTHLHEEQIKYIDSNVDNRAILVEKPLSSHFLNYQPKNRVLVSYNLRFHPVITKLKALLSNQKLLSFSAQAGQYLPTWRPDQDYTQAYSFSLTQGGGVLRDLSHELDYVSYLCGELSIVSALSTSNSHLNLSADDMTTVLASNAQGAHIQIQVDYLSHKPKRNIDIQTDALTISASLIDNVIDIYNKDGFVERIDFGNVERNYTYKEVHRKVLESQYESITTFAEGNQTMALIDDITNNYMEKRWLTSN